MKNNKKFQFFNDLQTSDALKQKILDKTINNNDVKPKYNVRKIPKLAYGICIITIISFIGCAGVVAVEFINNNFIEKSFKDGLHNQTIIVKEPVSINNINNISCKGKKLNEIEETLGLKFAIDKNYNNIIDDCDITTNNKGKIELMKLIINNYKDLSNGNLTYNGAGDLNSKHISLEIGFITTNASNETQKNFAALNEFQTAKEIEIKEIELINLNTMAYAYEPIRPGSGRWWTIVTFTHNNIVYVFTGYKIHLEETINFVQSLNFNY